MKRLTPVAFVILLFQSGPSFASTKTDANNSEVLILEKAYHIISIEKGNELGSCNVKAISKQNGTQTEILEQMQMDYGGKKVGWKSNVVYSCKPALAPLGGTVETTVDSNTCMKGAVAFSKSTLSVSCLGFINKRTGQPIQPPSQFEQKDIPKPKGNILFQSSVQVLSPMYLQAAGELKDVVFVEFPDDIGAPELINWKEGYRLVREQAGEKGIYGMKLFAPKSDEPVWSIQFDKDDKPTSMSCSGKMRFVEVDKNKQ